MYLYVTLYFYTVLDAILYDYVIKNYIHIKSSPVKVNLMYFCV